MDLDTRRLRAFLMTAQALHFSRAADILHLSQPALSQQIRSLERDLGVELFVRTSRRVELTAAGESLLLNAPRVVYELDKAVESARQAARGVTGRLVIGSVRTGLTNVLPLVMREFTAAQPLVRFDLEHMDTSLQLQALSERRIDVGIVRAVSSAGSLLLEPLVSEPLMVAMPADHALAAADQVEPAALAGERFVAWPRHLGADFFDLVVAYCREHGFNPDVVTEGEDIDTQLALVAAGFGVSLQPAYYATVAPPGVVFRALADTSPSVALQIAWRHDSSAAVLAFVDAARRVRAALVVTQPPTGSSIGGV